MNRQAALGAHAVEHMLRQRVTFGKVRHMEIAAGIACHPDPLHDPPRPRICDGGKGYDLLKSQRAESEGDGRACRFVGIANPPKTVGKPPANFEGRREVRVKADIRQAGEAEECPAGPVFQCPEAEAVPIDMAVQPIDDGVRLLAGLD